MSTTSIQTQMGYAAQASPITHVTPSVSPAPAAPERAGRTSSRQDFQNTSPRMAEPQPLSQDADVKTRTAIETQRTTRKTDVDWQTNELVYRVIDSRSGQVVSQSPDEALLRLRAYAKQALTQSAAEQIAPYHMSREL